MTVPFCERHKRRKAAVCKHAKCPDVFVCEGRECVVEHLHSRQLMSVYFIERLIRETEDLQNYIVKEMQAKIQQYYERACEEINAIINQHKEMTLLLLDKYRPQISLSEENARLIGRLKGEGIYSCSKDEIIQGWELLACASTQFTKDKEIGYLIKDINKAVQNFEKSLQKLDKSGLRKMFDFQGSVFKELNEVDLTKEEYDVLEDLLSKKGVTLKRARVAYNAREHNYSASKYHEICNGLQNTVTIIRSQNKRLFGGFVSKKISSSGNWESDSKAFLFSVDNKTLCNQFSNHTYALYFPSNYGPTWGGNHDLYLADNCGNNSDSYSQMNYTYKPDDTTVDQQYTLGGQRNFKVTNYLVLELDPASVSDIKEQAVNPNPAAGEEE